LIILIILGEEYKLWSYAIIIIIIIIINNNNFIMI
jgi:hypothetical protein